MSEAQASGAIEVLTLTPTLGAELRGVDLAALDDGQAAAVRDAFERYGAILVRGQRLGSDDLVAFSRRFGPLDEAPLMENGRTAVPGYPEIYVVSNVLGADGKPIGSLGAGEAVWHTDMSYLAAPPRASLLYALEVPPAGGDTWLCSMAAALEALPGDLRGPAAPGDLPASGRRPGRAVSRAPPQRLRHGSAAGRVRGASGPGVGSCLPGREHLQAPLAGRRCADVGQPRHHAPARPVRRRSPPGHAPHPDQGGGGADAGVRRGAVGQLDCDVAREGGVAEC